MKSLGQARREAGGMPRGRKRSDLGRGSPRGGRMDGGAALQTPPQALHKRSVERNSL